jgi:hypothetical protein
MTFTLSRIRSVEIAKIVTKAEGKSKLSIWTGLVSLITVLAVFGSIATSCQESEPTPNMPTPEEAWAADGMISIREYNGNIHNGDYSLNWWHDEQYIYIGIRAQASGWVAVGFQPQPLHRETDTVIGFVENGKTTVLDMYSTGDLGPCITDTELGGSDDIIEFGGSEVDGYTTIEFKRRLDTGDEYDGKLVPGINEIIWAYATLDDPRQKHFEHGFDEIDLK